MRAHSRVPFFAVVTAHFFFWEVFFLLAGLTSDGRLSRHLERVSDSQMILK